MDQREPAHEVARELAATCRASRGFRDGVPYVWRIEFGGSTTFSCPALSVNQTVAGDPAVLEALFLEELRAAARRVDPGSAPHDAVATALAVERATDDDLRDWIRPRDPALESAGARDQALQRAKDRDAWWQLHQPLRGWRR